MANRLPQEKIDLIESFYAEGYSQKEIAAKTGVSKSAVYNHTLLRERFDSVSEYREELARRKRFKSALRYENDLAEKRQQNPLYKRVGKLIKTGVRKKQKSQSWLAKRVGVTRQVMSSYARARTLPPNKVFRKICSALELPYKTLDDLL